MFEVYDGRPRDLQGRPEPEIRSYNLLDSLDIKYMRTEHPPADSMDVCTRRAAVLNTRICKNLFLCNRQETAFYLLLMPADKQFKTSVVSRQLGTSRLHFADERHMVQYLGLYPGSVSIMGLMYDTEKHVRLLIDKELTDQDEFACHPCINTVSLKFKTSELFEKVIPALKHEPFFVTL